MSKIILSTVSTTAIEDLGNVEFTHPISNFVMYDSNIAENEFELEELRVSLDLQASVDNGTIILIDGTGSIISNVNTFVISSQASLINSLVQGDDISLLNNNLGFETPVQLDNRDVNNRDRGNHTGTQSSSTINDFQSTVSSNNDVLTNLSKVSADGSVTTHSDISGAGSGEIITLLERNNLSNQSGINSGDETDLSIKTKYENNSNTNAFTDLEKSKLSGLESSKFLGEFISLSALQSAFSSAPIGSYAYVDTGSGQDVQSYIWDSTDSEWVLQLGASTQETPASIKTKYESNADTNAFTDFEKSKLFIQTGQNTGDETLTSIQSKRPLKTIENQSLEGVGNIDLTKSDVGLSNVDNTSDLNKPISTLTQTALNGKEDSFLKNTAFNKDFGIIAGSVLEGNTRTITNVEVTKLLNTTNTNSGDETTSTIQSKRPIKTVGGITLEGNGNIPFPTSNDVQSVTGDGVNNTDPQNPVLAFPNADEVDDASTNNKFVTQAEKNTITANSTNITQNTTDIADAEVIITQNTTDIQSLQNGSMSKSVYDSNNDGIVDKAQNVIYKAQLNQNVVKGNLLYGIGRNSTTGNVIVGLADNTVSFADKTVGMALQSGNSGSVIEVVKIGVIEDINTSLFAVGETIYLSTFGTFDQKSNITTGIFNPVGFVVKSGVLDGVVIIDTTATESIDTDNTINQSTVTGRTVTDALNNLSSSIAPGVQSVTGGIVDNTNPLNPVVNETATSITDNLNNTITYVNESGVSVTTTRILYDCNGTGSYDILAGVAQVLNLNVTSVSSGGVFSNTNGVVTYTGNTCIAQIGFSISAINNETATRSTAIHQIYINNTALSKSKKYSYHRINGDGSNSVSFVGFVTLNNGDFLDLRSSIGNAVDDVDVLLSESNLFINIQ